MEMGAVGDPTTVQQIEENTLLPFFMAPSAAFLLAFLSSVHGLTLGPGVDLFAAYSGKAGYPTCYRQPVLTVLNGTHLVAFAEGRMNTFCSGSADGSNSSIWVRSSGDSGSTWSEAAMLYDAPPQPDYLSAVYDATTGRVLLFIQTSPNLQLTSDDAGVTWSKPAPVVISLPSGYSATPGVAHGIQIQGALCGEPTCGGTVGRLVVAWVCHAKKSTPTTPTLLRDTSCPGCFSCLATSDNGGASWEIAPGGVSTAQEGSREASLVQLKSTSTATATATVYASERNMGAAPGTRWHAISTDSGRTLTQFGVDPTLPDGDTKNWTGIVAGLARVGGDSLYFSTPSAAGARADLTLYHSTDECASWGTPGVVVIPGPAGYSDLGALNATHGAILCENGEKEFAQKISFFTFQGA